MDEEGMRVTIFFTFFAGAMIGFFLARVILG